MKSIWTYLIGVVIGTLSIGLVSPEIFAFLTPDTPVLLEEVLPPLPDPPLWVLLAAALTIVVSWIYPSTQACELADTRRRNDLIQTRKVLAYIIFILLILASYLFIWVGWSLRSFALE